MRVNLYFYEYIKQHRKELLSADLLSSYAADLEQALNSFILPSSPVDYSSLIDEILYDMKENDIELTKQEIIDGLQIVVTQKSVLVELTKRFIGELKNFDNYENGRKEVVKDKYSHAKFESTNMHIAYAVGFAYQKYLAEAQQEKSAIKLQKYSFEKVVKMFKFFLEIIVALKSCCPDLEKNEFLELQRQEVNIVSEIKDDYSQRLDKIEDQIITYNDTDANLVELVKAISGEVKKNTEESEKIKSMLEQYMLDMQTEETIPTSTGE